MFLKNCSRIITYVLKEPKWFSIESMLIYRDYVLVFKCLRELAPDYLAKKFKNDDTRKKNKMDIPGYRTTADQRTFHHRAVSLWNSLPERFAELETLQLIRHLQ